MKYYCRDQFKTMHIRSTNSGQVLVSPCCAAQTEPVAAADFDFATNRLLQQTRQHTIDNTPAPACTYCWRQEAQNPPSRRFFSNQNNIEDIRIELNRIDVTTQNVCNLACIMCSSYSSSTWAREEGLTNQDYSFEDKLKLFRRLDFSKVYQMHFTGGEPLMTTEHLKMLGIYAESSPLSQLHISYNTNGTFFPDQRVLDTWAKVKAIDLVISLDAIGAACELIRWPAKWEQIAANIAKFFELRSQIPHLKIGFISCASNYNLFELADVIDFVHEHDPELTVHFQVNHKPYFAPALIPPEMLQPITARLGAYPELTNLVSTIQTQPDTDHYVREIKTYHRVMKEMETSRGTDWRSVLQIGKYMS
jgi:pyruvate-formate lyase-activating enzyme